MNFEHEIKSDKLIIRISGDLIGEDSGTQLVSIASQAIAQGVPVGVIDIAHLRYVNSAGIGVLITILTKFRNKGGEVFLMNPSESVRKLLIITKLNSIFQVIASVDEAVLAKK